MVSDLDASIRDGVLREIGIALFFEDIRNDKNGREFVNTTIGRERNKNLAVVDNPLDGEFPRLFERDWTFVRPRRILSQSFGT